MKLFRLSLLGLMTVGLLMTTQSCKTMKSASINELAGEWSLKTLNGEKAEDGFKGSIPSIRFDVAEMQVSGSGGCNNYTGKFTYADNKFSAPALASTMMACFEANKEHEFLKTLSDPSDLSINKEGNLVLSQAGKPVLVFAKQQAASLADLAGEWTLTKIEKDDAKKVFNPNNLPSIEFKEGRVSGNAGCNRYNGKFEFNAGVLSVSSLISTRMACEFLAGESRFTQLLEGDSKVSLEKGNLVISKNGKAILTFSK